jgi:hypothetical protein
MDKNREKYDNNKCNKEGDASADSEKLSKH